jgi:hypothetical protein
VSESAPESSESECRTDEYGVSDLTCYLNRFLGISGYTTFCVFYPDLIENLIKGLSIFCEAYRLRWCPENGYTIFREDSSFLEFESAVQCGLSSECEHDPIRTFSFDDLLHVFRSHRQEIELIGESGIGLYSRDIRIHEDGLDSFLFESLDRLTPRVVEFSGFTDLEGSRA